MNSSKPIWDKGDGSVKGLHIKTSKAGVQSFYLFYRNKNGVQRRPKLGEVGTELSLSTARKLARSMWEDIARGKDPSEERIAKRAEPTVQEMFEIAVHDHWSDERFIASGFLKEVTWNYERHVKSAFGSMKLSEVTAPLVLEWHRKLKSKPFVANRSKSVLSKVMKLAEQKGFKPVGSNPCAVVPNFAERSRERTATKEEIAKIYSILDRESSVRPLQSAFIMLLMLTGSRPSAIERATWDQLVPIEHEGKTVFVLSFDGKTGREIVAIPPRAMEILNSLPRTYGQIFGIKMPRRFWDQVRKEANCTDLWARDWRRTFASQGLSLGISMDKIGRTLNHKSQQTTLTYARLQDTTRIETATKIAEQINLLGLRTGND
jgi:integrase